MTTNKFLFIRILLFFGLFLLSPTLTLAQSYSTSQNNTSNSSQANALFSKGNFREVTQVLWKNFDRLTRSELLLLIKSHLKLSEYDKVVKIVDILTSKNPKDYEAFSFLGNAYFLKAQKLKAGDEWKKSREKAVESYKSALEIKKDYINAYTGLIQLYEAEKNIYELRQIYRDLIEMSGDQYAWLIKLCEIDTNDSIYDSALKNCDKAKKSRPSDPKAFVFYAKALYGMGELEKGKLELKNTALQFKNSDFANSAYADLLFEEKNYQDAFKFYGISSQLNPQSYEAWIGYANSSFEIQKFAEALTGYSKACTLNKLAWPILKKSTNILRNSSNLNWLSKYESATERCGLRK
ncbi:MAG TPA: hypothetical protein PLJ21_04700 [Pseudobdellovibrionaceae bacterium]|nr:hypothetical protein [Pseudobdellovibrionaceae bacterium]